MNSSWLCCRTSSEAWFGTIEWSDTWASRIFWGVIILVTGGVLWWVGMPLLGVGWAIDQIFAPLFRRAGWSNTYRVVARKVASS